MDNREAKEWLESINFEIPSVKTQKAVMVAIQAIEELEKQNKFFNQNAPCVDSDWKELQQYRELGTVEETKQFMSEVHRLMDSEKMLVEYIKLGTLEQVREAVERMKPKKVVRKPNKDSDCEFYLCPNCGKLVGTSIMSVESKYCSRCACGLDWTTEETKEQPSWKDSVMNTFCGGKV